MSLQNSKAPSLKEKLIAQERDVKDALAADSAELDAIKRAKGRAKKN